MIFEGSYVCLPLADVQHVEKHASGGLVIVTKHTRWDHERDGWANNAFIPDSERTKFMSEWRDYLSRKEGKPNVTSR